MTFNGIRLEYALEGNSNFIDSKDHVEEVFDENGLVEFIERDVTKPTESYAQNLAHWKKVVTNLWIIILEGVQDHIVSNLHGKENPYGMWWALTNLF